MSVSSQADIEKADLAREQYEHAADPEFERKEPAEIYIARGVTPHVAELVAQQLMARDALGAHARDELGISEIAVARPIQAAVASALSFTMGAAAPLLLALASPMRWLVPVVSVGALVFLALFGMIGARTGGAGVLIPTPFVSPSGAPW